MNTVISNLPDKEILIGHAYWKDRKFAFFEMINSGNFEKVDFEQIQNEHATAHERLKLYQTEIERRLNSFSIEQLLTFDATVDQLIKEGIIERSDDYTQQPQSKAPSPTGCLSILLYLFRVK